jgi:murein DD-endopeptidase MepM/ murein hydrolase activator NlpD
MHSRSFTVVRLCTVLAVVLGLSFSPATFRSASATDQRDGQEQELRAEFRESTRAASRAYTRAQELDAAAKEARTTAARAAEKVSAAEALEDRARSAAARAKVAADIAAARVEAAGQSLEAAKDELGVVARNLYIQGPANTATVLLNAEDLSAVSREIEMTRWAGKWQERRIAQFDRARIQQAEATRSLSEKLIIAQESAARATATADEVRRVGLSAQRASRDASRLSRQAAVVLRTAQTEAKRDEARYRAFRAETQRLQQALKNPASRPTGPASNGLILPVNGPITSPYGMRKHPITGQYKLHSGVDLGAPCGTPVKAAANGRVLSAGFDRAYGYRIVIRHGRINGKDVTTTYNHQNRLGVSAGANVQQGQIIGSVGSTGYSTGCHMHFEVLVNGSFVNPMSW